MHVGQFVSCQLISLYFTHAMCVNYRSIGSFEVMPCCRTTTVSQLLDQSVSQSVCSSVCLHMFVWPLVSQSVRYQFNQSVSQSVVCPVSRTHTSSDDLALIAVCGGDNASQRLSSCIQYSIPDDKWSTLPDMLHTKVSQPATQSSVSLCISNQSVNLSFV